MNYGVDIGRKLLRLTTAGDNFNRLVREVRLVEFSANRCVCNLTVAEEHTNPHGTLHGGFATTLVDTISTMAVIANGRGVPGVSVDMNVSFLQSAKIGEDIRIVADCIKSGKSLAFATVDIFSGDKLIVTGRHTKHVGQDNSIPLPGLMKEESSV